MFLVLLHFFFWLHWAACGVFIPWPGNLHPLHWKCWALTTGPQGKSQQSCTIIIKVAVVLTILVLEQVWMGSQLTCPEGKKASLSGWADLWALAFMKGNQAGASRHWFVLFPFSKALPSCSPLQHILPVTCCRLPSSHREGRTVATHPSVPRAWSSEREHS